MFLMETAINFGKKRTCRSLLVVCFMAFVMLTCSSVSLASPTILEWDTKQTTQPAIDAQGYPCTAYISWSYRCKLPRYEVVTVAGKQVFNVEIEVQKKQNYHTDGWQGMGDVLFGMTNHFETVGHDMYFIDIDSDGSVRSTHQTDNMDWPGTFAQDNAKEVKNYQKKAATGRILDRSNPADWWTPKNGSIPKAFVDYIKRQKPDMLKQVQDYNKAHSEEILAIRRNSLITLQQQYGLPATAADLNAQSYLADNTTGSTTIKLDDFAKAYGKPPANYITVDSDFAWSDFLHEGGAPSIDVNWLIRNLWYVEEISRKDVFGSQGKPNTESNGVFRFAPFIWLNVGENKTTVKTLILTKIYGSTGKCTNYWAEAHDYGGKVTFDSANFIMNMDSISIPKEDAGGINNINVVNMDGATLATRQVQPCPMTFRPSEAKPESFIMDCKDTTFGETIVYRFTRIH